MSGRRCSNIFRGRKVLSYVCINRVLLTWNVHGGVNMFDLGAVDFQIFEKKLNKLNT